MFDPVEKKRVLLGVTGSIAAYKAIELARLLVQGGCEVRCILTEAAQKFIGAATVEAVTGNPVSTSFWEGGGEIEHIELADWADVVVIAPATADVIAKMVAGFSDTPLLATLLATRAPIVVAPAMNVNMWDHPTTQENIQKLIERKIVFVHPEEGSLACGWNGAGRLADPQNILLYIRRALSMRNHDFEGKHILITAGSTREAIDPVRFITNRSSGKMGIALALEAFRRGARVTLVHGPVSVPIPGPITDISIQTARELQQELLDRCFSTSDPVDIVIMAAAIADYRPTDQAEKKIKREQGFSSIELTENPDVLASVGTRRGERRSPILVGFAVETGELPELLEEQRKKMKKKNADMMIGNFAEEAFDLDTNRVWIIDKHGRQEEVATSFKSRIASKIFDAIRKLT